MPNDPNAPSFDLDGAREISQRLGRRLSFAKAKEVAPRVEDKGPAYTRFDASRFSRRVPTPPSEVVATEAATTTRSVSDAETTAQAGKPWGPLLDWFLELTGGHTCFVMDPAGLTAAARGRDSDQGDVVGPRLMIALEQASLMKRDGQAARAVVFEFGEGWVTGVSVDADEGSRVTVGLVSDERVDGHLWGAISATIAKKLRADI